MIDELTQHFRAHFDRVPVAAARAPGRVNWIGEHTDYNDGLVLPLAIDRATWVAAAPRDDGLFRVVSREQEPPLRFSRAEPVRQGDWGDYPRAALAALAERGHALPGADLALVSDLPLGSGLSSSAALLVGLCTAGFVWGAGYYSNHTYLLFTAAVLLSFSDCDATWSLRSRRGHGADRVWAAPVLVLRAQITIVYFYAAISKIRPDFLSGNGLASWTWDSVLVPAGMLTPVFLVPMAFGAVLTELFVAFGLWSSRLRPVAVVAGTGLHLGMIAMLSDGLHAAVELGLFATLTCGGYLLFADRVPVPGAVVVPRQRRFRPALPSTVTRR